MARFEGGVFLIGRFGIKAGAEFVTDFSKQITNALIGLINSEIIQRINRALEFTVSFGPFGSIDIDPHDIPDIPTLARGARNFRGGLAVVGELGPELVALPRGSDVFSNANSAAMLGSSLATLNTSRAERPIIIRIGEREFTDFFKESESRLRTEGR